MNEQKDMYPIHVTQDMGACVSNGTLSEVPTAVKYTPNAGLLNDITYHHN